MELVNALVENYVSIHTSEADILLQEVMAYTTKHKESHMISGLVQGQLLSMLSTIAKPQYILEVGTFTGFSALCLVKGLHKNGELHTIELREVDALVAQDFFSRSIFAKNIKLHIGNALNVIPTLNYTWDIVFLDADKVNYNNYYDLILPSVRQGGIIIADNVLFHGQVLAKEVRGKNAKAMDAFNKKIAADKSIEKVMLSVRDGLYIMLKK